jgi:polyisoprenoid-binding protein YceI
MAIATLAPGHASPRSNWAIDPSRTHISFSIDAIGYPRTQGEFRRFDGRLSVDFDHPAQSRVSFRVQSQSVDVGSASFSDYLRSDAFLNASHFSEIVFSSTAVEKIDENDIRVTGDLTMLGVTRPLTVDVEVRRPAAQSRARLEFTARAKIDRLEFGMNSGFPLISKDVDLVVASEAEEQ